ncbi:MFS transporter [Nocardia yamanashiensis]|uniref:MFS transporter n=1 Tax=Nocardia yamanashiensis TaxID=209247 RepID=UPI001E4DE188|nr:MFS transporter [Nocardia yamanashiensis]UGT45195.1 MFS transporter [Nocardia yamanashiensis]
MIDVLRRRRFRRLFTAQVVALIGTGLLTVALGLLAYDLAGADAGVVLGTALAIKMVAYVAVAPVISALTERVPRRVLLVSADAVRAGIALLLPFVGATWQIYLLIAVLQSASATFTPAFQSIIPAILVDEEQYTRGLSLSRLAYDLESLLSPVLAAALLSVISYHALFAGTAMGFMVSAALVVTTRLPRVEASERTEPLWHRITLGARSMAARPTLRGLLAMNLVVAAATSLVIVNTVVYVRERLGGSNTGVALALACYGLGSMAVALAAPHLLAVSTSPRAHIPPARAPLAMPNTVRSVVLRAPGARTAGDDRAGSMPSPRFAARSWTDRRLMLSGCLALPFGLLAAAVIPSLPSTAGAVALAVTWMLLGAGTSTVNTPAARLLRAHTGTRTRTAVFTAQFSLSHACFLVTYPIAGMLGAAAGLPITAITLAVIATLAGTTAAHWWPATGASVPADPEVVAAGR